MPKRFLASMDRTLAMNLEPDTQIRELRHYWCARVAHDDISFDVGISTAGDAPEPNRLE